MCVRNSAQRAVGVIFPLGSLVARTIRAPLGLSMGRPPLGPRTGRAPLAPDAYRVRPFFVCAFIVCSSPAHRLLYALRTPHRRPRRTVFLRRLSTRLA